MVEEYITMSFIQHLVTSTKSEILNIPTPMPLTSSPTPLPASKNQLNIKRLKDAQEMSCLYSEHVYKSLKKDHFFEAQLEKYKGMYEAEKKIKMKLLGSQMDWQQERKKMLAEREVILFALDSLTLKVAEEEQESKQNKSKKLSTAQEVKVRVSTIENGEGKDRKNDSKHLTGQLGVPKKATQARLSCLKEIGKKDVAVSELVSELSTPISDNDAHKKPGGFSGSDKLKLIKKLKEKLNIRNNPDIDQIFESSKESERVQLHRNQEFLELLQRNEASELTILELRREVDSLRSEIQFSQSQTKNQLQKVQQLKETLKKAGHDKEKADGDISELTEKVRALQEDNDGLRRKVEELEHHLKLTHEEYARKQDKQKQCVKILQQFSKELQLSDEKIQEFLNEEFGGETENELQRSKKTYHEHLSYILHLCKKKETLYETLVEDFKERTKESDFRVIILEKKVKMMLEVYSELKQALDHKAGHEELEQIARKFKK